MQLTRDNSAIHFIRAWEPGRVRVADRWLSGQRSSSARPDHRRMDDGTIRTDLTVAELEPALELHPTIIVLGTGAEACCPTSS